MKKYKSIVNEEVLKEFHVIRGRSLMNHVSNLYDIEMAIGFASLYCPEVVEVEDCIFISEFYNDNIDSLRKQFATRKDIEIFVNSWSLETLLATNCKINYDTDHSDEFARAIKYFWQLRMKELFPDRKIVVEIGEEIMGEIGLSVTMYQE